MIYPASDLHVTCQILREREIKGDVIACREYIVILNTNKSRWREREREREEFVGCEKKEERVKQQF